MTSDPAPGRRGPYAKGVAKREEILERALDVIASDGISGASVKRIADAVELSQAGLLHYFDSKEELFTEVLRKRDELDEGTGRLAGKGDLDDTAEGFLRIVRRNAERPGVVELFSRLAVDAADPQHPAREYFRARGADLRDTLGARLAAAQDAGEVSPEFDPDDLARLVQAVSDGLQLQWLHDDDVDLTRLMAVFFAVLRRS